jgi:DNA repair protein RecO (recombination protein O)
MLSERDIRVHSGSGGLIVNLYKTDALVLRNLNRGETDQLLVLFSLEYGKLKVMAHGSRKITSRKRGAIQPLTLTRFLIHKGRYMDSVRQCEELESFPDLFLKMDRICYATYAAELVENSTVEGEANHILLAVLVETLRQLGKGDPEIVARAFALKLVTLAGYKPVLNLCVKCRRNLDGKMLTFSPLAGGFMCAECSREKSEDQTFSCHRGTLETIKLMLAWELSKLGQLKVDAETRTELYYVLKLHLEYHLGYRCATEMFIEKLKNRNSSYNPKL